MTVLHLVALSCVVFFTGANKLPNFITKCSLSDPELGECIKTQLFITLPKVIDGNKEMRIPNMNPFKLAKIQIEATETLSLKLIDIEIHGLDKVKIDKLMVDPKTFKSYVEMSFDEVIILATYDIKGQIMILPIEGHGPAKISMNNIKFVFEFDWSLYNNDKGIEYAKLGDADLHYTAERSHFHFDNLFNGDKALGDNMNAFLEENWRDVAKEIEPSVSETIKIVVMGIFSHFADSMPYAEIFDP